MKEYRFKNATIYVHGEVNKERLKNATIQLFKKAHMSKLERSRKLNDRER